MDQSVQLRQVLNFRDVGQTVNRFLGRRLVREGLFFRSARPGESATRQAPPDWLTIHSIRRRQPRRQDRVERPPRHQDNHRFADRVGPPTPRLHTAFTETVHAGPSFASRPRSSSNSGQTSTCPVPPPPLRGSSRPPRPGHPATRASRALATCPSTSSAAPLSVTS